MTTNESTNQEATGNDSSAPATSVPTASTLIEFPGVARATRPQWRKQLSERVREIQERRAREAAREAEEAKRRRHEQPPVEEAAPQLGLVPPPPVAPEINPLVAAALRRIDRARQPSPMPRTRASMGGGAATAVARVAEEHYQSDLDTELAYTSAPATNSESIQASAQFSSAENRQAEKSVETAREHNLIIVPVHTVSKPETIGASDKRIVPEVTDDAMLTRLDEQLSAEALLAEPYDDYAPLSKRLAGGIIDLIVVAFASAPFAAIIELTNGNWADVRVAASMGGITLVLMFLYLAASTALSGRTWGMSLVSLRAVDVNTGLQPTTKQSIKRAFLYMLSLATLGLGLLYALFDAEGRTAHDHLSGTAVVCE